MKAPFEFKYQLKKSTAIWGVGLLLMFGAALLAIYFFNPPVDKTKALLALIGGIFLVLLTLGIALIAFPRLNKPPTTLILDLQGLHLPYTFKSGSRYIPYYTIQTCNFKKKETGDIVALVLGLEAGDRVDIAPEYFESQEEFVRFVNLLVEEITGENPGLKSEWQHLQEERALRAQKKEKVNQPEDDSMGNFPY